MLLHLPGVAVLAIERTLRNINVLLELARDLPLRIVSHRRRRRDEAARQDLSSVSEDGLTPPLQLPVRSGRKTAKERACLGELADQEHQSVQGTGKHVLTSAGYPWKPTGISANLGYDS